MGTFGNLGVWNHDATNTSKLVLEADCPVLVVPYSFKKIEFRTLA
jgi:hypothetical protein